jgi:hypothetical protein
VSFSLRSTHDREEDGVESERILRGVVYYLYTNHRGAQGYTKYVPFRQVYPLLYDDNPELALPQASQCTDSTYRALLKNHNILVGMNGIGSWYDNAPMESFFGSLKGG